MSSLCVGASEFDREIIKTYGDLLLFDMLETEENRLPEPREIRIECLKMNLLVDLNHSILRVQAWLKCCYKFMEEAKDTDDFYRYYYDISMIEKQLDDLFFIKAQLEE